jgi:hypothetical protein
MPSESDFTKVSNEITAYVRQWNKSATTSSFTLYTKYYPAYERCSDVARFSLGVKKGAVELIILQLNYTVSSRSLTGKMVLESLYMGIPSTEAYKLLEYLVQAAWQWKPSGIRMQILSPAFDKYKSSFPRYSYGDAHCLYSTPEECKQQIDTRWMNGDDIAIYRWPHPCSVKELYMMHHSRIYDNEITRRLDRRAQIISHIEKSTKPRVKESVNLNGLEDDVAEEGDLTCVVCLTNRPCIAASCNHLATCASCAKRISSSATPRCPKCRGDWTELRRIYI